MKSSFLFFRNKKVIKKIIIMMMIGTVLLYTSILKGDV